MDTAIASHGDADHIGDYQTVLPQFSVARLYDPGYPDTSSSYQKLLTTIDQKNIKYTTPIAGTVTITTDGNTHTVATDKTGSSAPVQVAATVAAQISASGCCDSSAEPGTGIIWIRNGDHLHLGPARRNGEVHEQSFVPREEGRLEVDR